MARIFLDSSIKSITDDSIRGYVETLFQQVEDQVNAGIALASLDDTNQTLPQGMLSGDIIFNKRNGELNIGIFDGSSVVYVSFGSYTGAITDSQHGTRSGGNLHPNATTSVSGFMSALDKTKSDQFLGETSSAAPASLTEYPNSGDWGFHTNTTAVTYVLARNKAGVIKSVALA
jgi:hypothetical protein